MPHLTKQALSHYIRTECLRRLRLDLSPDSGATKKEREAEGMPPRQRPRPGLEYLAQAGREWQDEKIADLENAFGSSTVLGNKTTNSSGDEKFQIVNLIDYLENAHHGCFIVEATFDIGDSFETRVGIDSYRTTYNLDYSQLRPDLIELLPSYSDSDKYITPNGEVKFLPDNDQRFKLRVIDIKLTAEASPSYFAEVTYYSMALAGWLQDNNLDNQYVVVPEAAIWPGTHDASNLVLLINEITDKGGTPTHQQMWHALQEDLEIVPFEVFVGRIKHFFNKDLPKALSNPWQDLAWHVDNKCKGCDYLGYPWLDQNGQSTASPLHCMPQAKQDDHLSRVAFISRGALEALRDQGIHNVADLAQLQQNSFIFSTHYSLQTSSAMVAGRALSLQNQQPEIPAQSGTSGVMPRYADLHIYLSVDFDLGSAITFALGIKGFWVEPKPYGFQGNRNTHIYRTATHIVDQKDLSVERRELIGFLNDIDGILTDALSRNSETTVQFYIWDSVQYNHLTRIIGRHLQYILADQTLQHLAWLFPPEELLPNPNMVTRRSPITIVRQVVRSLLAAPIPHYYTLFTTARVYHHDSLTPPLSNFSVHPLFEDTLSNQIPSERAHEIWVKVQTPRLWSDQIPILQETIGKQLDALETITRRLEDDLRTDLKQIAPKINIAPPQRQRSVSFDGQLWFGFAKLNSALGELEVHQIRAMSSTEREARYYSARLVRRLSGQEEEDAIQQLDITRTQRLRIYELQSGSREVKARKGDFSFAISPENRTELLDMFLQQVIEGTNLEDTNDGWRYRMEDITGVSIVEIDRDVGFIALETKTFFQTLLEELEQEGLLDFSHDVMLDPVWIDTFTNKLKKTLQDIGNPDIARDNPLIRQATGLSAARRGRRTSKKPVADILWNSNALANTSVIRDLPKIREILESNNILLNPSQWIALETSLSNRLQVIWGPPGTGKSRTLRAITVGAVVDASENNYPLRILICAPTYNALDNVLLSTINDISQNLSITNLQSARIRSRFQPRDSQIPISLDLELNNSNPSPQYNTLLQRLKNKVGITIVGATPEQTHNLLIRERNNACNEFFDIIILDEASQIDVGHAILPFAGIAEGGSLVVAGDPKQLPPIHQAKPPSGLEAMVGSIYQFLVEMHNIQPAILNENYRSNKVIVDFAYEAGYERSLESYSPDLRINLLSSVPTSTTQPRNWPQVLHWSPEWAALLDPDLPVSCFVYSEGRSSQWNPFEADSVTVLAYLLYSRLSSQLRNEKDTTTNDLIDDSDRPYDMNEFWSKGIGIVTPHRAQQALIVSKLQEVFVPMGATPEQIRSAVDTVERFQGQQRDVIIASYALGDQDAIQQEEEFLLSLNRFNVMSSRARAKLICLVTQEVVNHLSNDVDVLWESRLLKVFVESFCSNSRPMTLGHVLESSIESVEGVFKWTAF